MKRMSRKVKPELDEAADCVACQPVSLSGYWRLHGLSTTTMRYRRQVLADGPAPGTVIPAGAGLPVIVPVPMPGRPAESPTCPGWR